MELSWNPSLKIGHDLIDSQHVELFRLFDEFIEGSARGAGRDSLLALHQSLKDYTNEHFRAEEALMEDAGYPKLSQHRREHQRFKDELATIRSQISPKGPSLMNLVQTNKALVAWLINHVKDRDQNFGDYLANRETS